MQTRVYGNEFRTTTLCIDSYDNGVLKGQFYNPYFTSGEAFSSLSQFLVKVEQALDAMQFPQSFTYARSFSPPPEQTEHPPITPAIQEGVLATFAVRILFRQNASWQGSVTWLDRGQEESFRSVLELILLMDSALRGLQTP